MSSWVLVVCVLGLPWLAQAQEAAAPPAEEPAITLTGSLFTRYEWRRGYPGPGITNYIGTEQASDAMRYRARFGLHSKKFGFGEASWFRGHFEPQSGGFWHVGGSSLEDATLGLHQGYLEIQAGERARLDVGRLELVYGEHLVIGNVGWHHLGRSFDGVRLHLSPVASAMFVDVFCTTIGEGLIDGPYGDPFAAGDTYFTGAYLGLGPLFMEKFDLDIYLLSRIWGGVDAPLSADPDAPALDRESAAEVTAGVRSKGAFGLLRYRVEAGAQFGTRPVKTPEAPNDVQAYQADLEVGVDLKEVANLEVSVEGFIASGDDTTTPEDESYNQLFPTAHKWLGLMDVAGGRTNIAGGVLHAIGAFDKIKTTLDVHTFWRAQPDALARADGSKAYEYLGSEVDLGVGYTFGGGLGLRGLYGQFIPETAESFDDHLHYVEVELSANF